MPTIYTDGRYLDQNPGWHVQDSVWKAERILQMMVRNGMQPSTVCDVGCGAGEILAQMVDRLPDHVQYVGFDVSPHAFALCSRREAPRLRFFMKNPLSEYHGSFDVVLAIDVVEHIDDYLGFLRRLRHLGRDKIFHIPLDLSVQTMLRREALRGLRRRVGHLHYFTKETAFAMLEDTGYQILDHFYTSWAVELPSRSWRSTLLRLPRVWLSRLNQPLAARLLGGYSLMILAK